MQNNVIFELMEVTREPGTDSTITMVSIAFYSSKEKAELAADIAFKKYPRMIFEVVEYILDDDEAMQDYLTDNEKILKELFT